MNASFRIYLPDGTPLTEDALRKNLKAARQTIAKLGEIEGGITLENPKTKEATHLGDTLPVLMSAFCLEGLAELKKAGKSHVEFFNHEESVDVLLEKSKVTLSGSRIVTRSYPTAPYFKALADCGKRYLELMKKIK